MAITSNLSVLLLCSILCQVTKKNKFGGFRKIYWAVFMLIRILMWSYHSKVNYLCVKLRVHFRVFRKKNGGSEWFWQFLVDLSLRISWFLNR